MSFDDPLPPSDPPKGIRYQVQVKTLLIIERTRYSPHNDEWLKGMMLSLVGKCISRFQGLRRWIKLTPYTCNQKVHVHV